MYIYIYIYIYTGNLKNMPFKCDWKNFNLFVSFLTLWLKKNPINLDVF